MKHIYAEQSDFYQHLCTATQIVSGVFDILSSFNQSIYKLLLNK